MYSVHRLLTLYTGHINASLQHNIVTSKDGITTRILLTILNAQGPVNPLHIIQHGITNSVKRVNGNCGWTVDRQSPSVYLLL